MKVCVGLITHRHGTDCYVGRDEATLYRKLAAFCRQWWDETERDKSPGPGEEPEHTEPPADDKACVEAYFDGHPSEYWDKYLEEEID